MGGFSQGRENHIITFISISYIDNKTSNLPKISLSTDLPFDNNIGLVVIVHTYISIFLVGTTMQDMNDTLSKKSKFNRARVKFSLRSKTKRLSKNS